MMQYLDADSSDSSSDEEELVYSSLPGIFRVGGRDGMQLYWTLASMVDLSVSHSQNRDLSTFYWGQDLTERNVRRLFETRVARASTTLLAVRWIAVKNVEIHREKVNK